jgi:hypothetical protein
VGKLKLEQGFKLYLQNLHKGVKVVVLQVNCRSIYNKAIKLWNLVGMYNSDVIIGMESWLKEDISSANVFRADFTTFRRSRCGRGEGTFVLKIPIVVYGVVNLGCLILYFFFCLRLV